MSRLEECLAVVIARDLDYWPSGHSHAVNSGQQPALHAEMLRAGARHLAAAQDNMVAMVLARVLSSAFIDAHFHLFHIISYHINHHAYLLE